MLFRVKIGSKKQNGNGFFLIEASLILVLSVMVIFGIISYYQSSSEIKKTQETMTLVMNVMNAMDMNFSNGKDFGELIGGDDDVNVDLFFSSINIPNKYKDYVNKKNNQPVQWRA